MAQQRATIILSSDTRQAEAGINRVNSGLTDSKTKALELSTAFNQMNLSIAGSSSTLGALRNLLNTLGLGVAVHQLTEYMDAWQNLNARLKLVTNSYQEFQTAQKGVFDIAQQTRQGLKESTNTDDATNVIRWFGICLVTKVEDSDPIDSMVMSKATCPVQDGQVRGASSSTLFD